MAYGVPDDRWRWRGLWLLFLGLFGVGWIIFGTAYKKAVQDKNEHQWTKCATSEYQFVLTANGGESRGTVTAGECTWYNVVIASCDNGCGYQHCVEWNAQVFNSSKWDCVIKTTDCGVFFRFDMPNPYLSTAFVWFMILVIGSGLGLFFVTFALSFWEEMCCFADHSAPIRSVGDQ